MLIKAEQKNTRQSPRKVRLVANTVRKMDLEAAITHLTKIQKRASLVVLKTIRQAIANATHNHGLNFQDLELKNILVNSGPIYKRFRAVSRGRAHNIYKRTCHVKVLLETSDKNKSKNTLKKKTKKPKAKKVKPTAKKVDLKKEQTVEARSKEQIQPKQVKQPKADAKRMTKNVGRRVQKKG